MNTFHFNFVKRWDPIRKFLRKKHVNMISGKKKYVHKIIKDSLYNFRLIKKHETHYLFFWPHQVLQTLKTQHSLWFFVYSRGSKHTSISWNYHTGNRTVLTWVNRILSNKSFVSPWSLVISALSCMPKMPGLGLWGRLLMYSR